MRKHRNASTVWKLAMLAVLVAGGGERAHADSFTDGFAHHQRQEFGEAHRLYTSATREDAAIAEVWYHLGLVERHRETPRAAVRAFQKALDLEPHSPFAYRFRTNLGWALIESGEVARGVDELIAVARRREEDYNAVANVGHALFLHAKDFNEAEVWYKQLVDRFPPSRGERATAAQWHREARQNATILKIGIGYEVYRGEIIGGEFQGRNYGPSPSATRIVIRTTDGAEVTIRKSDIRSATTEPKYKGAGRIVRRGKDTRRAHTYGLITAAENISMGRTLLARDDAAAAEGQFATALRKRPKATEVPFLLAVTRYRLRRYAEAAAMFELCVNEPATEAQARYYLVSAYANHLGDLRAALENALAYIQLPDAKQREAIDTAAIRIVSGLIADHPDVPESRWTRDSGLQLDTADHRRILGLAYFRANQYGPALRHLGAAAELGAGSSAGRALSALELCIVTLEKEEHVPPSVRYYRGYLHFAAGDMTAAATVLQGTGADTRAQTLLALVYAYQQEPERAHAALVGIDAHALPPPTRRLFHMARAVLAVPDWYEASVAARKDNAFAYARVGAINGLGVYSETNEGDLMPIIVSSRKNGRGRLEVNGNPMFDLFSVISFKEAFDWVEMTVDTSFPNQWDTTITFGGLSLYLAKGGDSAGCAIALALCSVVTEQPVLQDVALTGAIRLDGRVEPVGSVPEKIIGAVARDIRTIILPTANAGDLENLDAELCSRVKFITVSSVTEARFHAFGEHDPATADTYAELERRFRTGCRYYRLGAYTLARAELEAVYHQAPENFSAQRLLAAMGSATVGNMQPDALGE